MGPVSVLIRLDVFQFVISDIFDAIGILEDEIIPKIFSLSMRLLIVLVFFVEVQRMLPMLVYFLVIPAHAAIRCIKILLSHAKEVG